MAFYETQHVAIRGIAACVPKQISENSVLDIWGSQGADSFILSTGVERRRVSDVKTCTSDLCIFAAEKLLDSLKWKKEEVDYFIFHQANLFMNEKIRKKLKLPIEKVPYSLKDFGNTSSASIPLTLVTQVNYRLNNDSLSHIACGFGVGLSWGSVYFKTNKITCLDLLEYDNL